MSRLTTQNAGNEALSKEFIEFFHNLLPRAEMRALDRYPQYLAWVTISHLSRGRANLERSFDDFCLQLIRKYGDQGQLAPVAKPDMVHLDPTAKEAPGRIKAIKRWIGFRRRLAHLGIMGQDTMHSAVRSLQWSDVFVWNPAGEIHPTGKRDEVLRLLIVVRMAQLLGKQSLIVNHSIEIEDPELKALVSHVYRHADAICVREHSSFEVAVALGVEANRLIEAPDMVFLAAGHDTRVSPDARDRFPKGAICFAINGLEAKSLNADWDRLLQALKQRKRPLVFLSNAMNHDLPFARQMAAKYGVKVIEHQPGYRQIRGYYADVSVLISSRLHSSILALCESVPVVTIEPSAFKLTAIFQQLKYPIQTARLSDNHWVEHVLRGVDQALDAESNLPEVGHSAALNKCQEIHTKYRTLLETT